MTGKSSSQFGTLQNLTGDQIRNRFLTFFADRDHKLLPSASLVPEDPTVLLTIAGMLPFKPVFLGHMARPAARATSSQKCIRTNDIENVGITKRHHTFFEMLGNFSFGDYFKKEAIQWAWELSTNTFGLDPKNLVVSVFREDEETEIIWRDVVKVNPKRIIRMDEADNFWASGPTGPCGPCSEMYYDFNPELGDEGIDLEDDNRFIEFYNLVFMQYNRDSEGKLTPLAKCNIDTGMGLERMAQILQGVPNNYETDLIFPLLDKAASLAKIKYHHENEKTKTSLKVIADHTRAVIHLISDGVIPSNIGRGYVLRRLVRRIIRHGRLIGISEPFLNQIGESAIQLMRTAFPELLVRRDLIMQELQREETRFLETLERGEKLLADLIACDPPGISGEKAFELYDTFGFPLELTEEIAQENRLTVDRKGFQKAMEAQRRRAKASSVTIDLTLQNELDRMAAELEATKFEGFSLLTLVSTVQALVVDGRSTDSAKKGDVVDVVLDQTSFYGEGGGQVGDQGVLVGTKCDIENFLVSVKGVTRNKDLFVHSGRVERGTIKVGDLIEAKVDRVYRRRAQAHHTATHLLQSALKNVVDEGISQAGSLVNFDRLRFDFYSPHGLTTQEIKQVEDLVNQWIAEAHILKVEDMTLSAAKSAGAVAMFGEKYSDIVRVVNVPGVSMELCGGTHVANTSELGIFKIIDESGIASGIRRIEAVAGPAVLDFLNERDCVVKKLGERFKAQPKEIVDRVVALQLELKEKGKELDIVLEKLALTKISSLKNDVVVCGDFQLLVSRLDGIQGAGFQNTAQELLVQLGQHTAVVLGGVPDSTNPQKVIFAVAFGSLIISTGLKAGKFVGSIAQICGGGGGGRDHFAQAGGRDPQALDEALSFAFEELKRSLS